jgi:serine protease Do
LVAEVTPGGPAAEAGIERGDVITAFAGTPITDAHELPALVARTPVGKTVEVTVLRGGQEETIPVMLGKLAEQQAGAERGEESGAGWGLTVANLSIEARRRLQLPPEQQGVVVTAVEPGSPADLAGIRPGDIIEEVNRQPVHSLEDFREAVSDAKEQETLLLLVQRGDASSFFALRKTG